MFSLGHDSNPAAEEGRGEDSFFEEISFNLNKQFLPSWKGNLWGFYRNYERTPDTFYSSFEVTYNVLSQNYSNVDLLFGLSMYRNGLKVEDEFNSFYLALEGSRLFSSRWMATYYFQLENRSYIHFDTIKRFLQHGKRHKSRRGEFSLPCKKISRDDKFYLFKSDISYASNRSAVSLGFLFANNSSDFKLEDYVSVGVVFKFMYLLNHKTWLQFEFVWQSLDYARAPHKANRTDYYHDYTLQINYDLSDRQYVFFEIDHVNNQSPLEQEDFERSFVRCGWAFSF